MNGLVVGVGGSIRLAVSSVFFPWSGGGLQNVIHSEDHLRGFGGLDQDLPLDTETLRDAQVRHAADRSLVLKHYYMKNVVQTADKFCPLTMFSPTVFLPEL